MVELVRQKLQRDSVDQYKIEERSIVAKRIISSGDRIAELQDICQDDPISLQDNIKMLGQQIYELTLDVKFKRSKTMGQILALALDFVKRNYENVSMKQIIENKISGR